MKNLDKIVLIFLFLIFQLCISYSQNQFVLEWQKAQNSQINPFTWDCPEESYRDQCHKIKFDSEGNIIIGANSLENGPPDFLIIKYSKNGDLLWKKVIDGGSNSIDYLTDIEIDQDDHIIVAGTHRWSSEQAKSKLIKFDPDGDILWERFYSYDYNWSFPHDVEIDTNGDIYMTGYTSNFSSGPPYPVRVDFNMFLAKYTKNGAPLWDHVHLHDSPTTSIGVELRILDSSVVVLSTFNSFDYQKREIVIYKYDKTGIIQNSTVAPLIGINSYHIDNQGNGYTGASDYFKVALIDSSTSKYWEYEIPTNLLPTHLSDRVYDIISDEDGNIYITGFHYGDSLLNTRADLQVVKLSPTGTPLFQYRYEGSGGNTFETGRTLSLDKDKNLVIGGTRTRTFGGDYDYLIIVLDSTGNATDTLTYQTVEDDMLKNLIIDDDLNFYVSGVSNGQTIIQKYSTLNEVGIEKFGEEVSLKISPNPFSNHFNIDLKSFTEKGEIRLFDSMGRLVLIQENKPGQSITVEVPHLPDGVYIYQIISANQQYSGKILKQSK